MILKTHGRVLEFHKMTFLSKNYNMEVILYWDQSQIKCFLDHERTNSRENKELNQQPKKSEYE